MGTAVYVLALVPVVVDPLAGSLVGASSAGEGVAQFVWGVAQIASAEVVSDAHLDS